MKLKPGRAQSAWNPRDTYDRRSWTSGDYLPALDALMRLLHAKDGYTVSHCRRVSKLSRLVASTIGLEASGVHTAMVAALYHDIGKLGIVNSVLTKPGQLSPSEWRSITTHPTIGCELLESFLTVRRAAVVIQQHHESWDGSGYPFGLRQQEILPEARVLRVCDVYDALVSDRPYRPAYTPSEAVEIITDGIGTQFEPNAAEALLSLAAELRRAA